MVGGEARKLDKKPVEEVAAEPGEWKAGQEWGVFPAGSEGALAQGPVASGIADSGDLQAETGFQETEEKDWVVKQLG